MAKAKTVYVCSSCGEDSIKWMGKCPSCGKWNTMEEMKIAGNTASPAPQINSSKVYKLDEIEIIDEERYDTGMGELNHVLGGGLVRGSLVLVGGDPGIGKSTLLLQICRAINKKILYASGEESLKQLKIRASRLNVNPNQLLLCAETDIDTILNHVHNNKPSILIVDSIQTVMNTQSQSAPGSVTQVRECTMKLMTMAKQFNIAVFIVGHVTKEGAIAGPKILEHMVDTVLYFEGDKNQFYRILRTVKNRFGATNEIAIFEMKNEGLKEVLNPSAALLEERPVNVSGSVVTCTLEGNRPLLVEIQALTTENSYAVPRRVVNGFDYNRASILIAIIEKRLGLRLQNKDVFINVTGGIKLEEPAADLAIVAAVISAYKNIPPDPYAIFIGEVGLSGEVRTVNQLDKRINEGKKLGFSNFIVPYDKTSAHGAAKIKFIKDIVNHM